MKSRNVTPDKYESYRIYVIFPGYGDLIMKLKYLTPSVPAPFAGGTPSRSILAAGKVAPSGGRPGGGSGEIMLIPLTCRASGAKITI